MRKLVVFGAAAVLLAGCASITGTGPVGNASVPQPAKSTDLDRYLGKWYELARYEAPFQRGCEAVTAEYTKNSDGTVRVLNQCRKGSIDGKLKSAEGNAKIVANSQGSKLKVSFFGPFFGDYWVLDHAGDYSWSIVGEPSGRYLWVLSRDPIPVQEKKSAIFARVRELGYDMNLLRYTKHGHVSPAGD